MPWRPDHLVCGVTYWPAAVGPYLWHAFSAERTASDFARIRRAGFGVVRVHLAWDAFVPTHRQVSRHRLRDLETLLRLAGEASLQVVPVLFAQSLGSCVLLPRYAVRRDRPWPGVRVVSDGIVESGGPRDVWDDPLMLEVEVTWLEELLRAFSNHPALLAWDLGHDPATTCRPIRTAHMGAWAALMGGRVRAAQDPCWLSLGALDVLSARGVRLAAVAPHVDAVGMVVHPQRLPLEGDALDPLRVLFAARLAQRLIAPSGDEDAAPSLVVHTGVVAEPIVALPADGAAANAGAAEEVAPALPQDAVRHTGALLERLPSAGAVAAFASSWCDVGSRALEAAPFDRQPWVGRLGLARPTGELKAHGTVWASAAVREAEAGVPAPWPAGAFDVDDWYANVSDASNDEFARFRTEFGETGQ